jgi:hypothetical protein
MNLPWRRRAGLVLALWPGFGSTMLADDVRASAPSPGPVSRPTEATSQERVDVWVELDVPPLASVPPGHPEQRTALRQRIAEQQDAVAAGLSQLGGIELGRVQLLRNAVAVRLPINQIAEAHRIPGVHGVRPVRNAERPPPRSRE